VRASCARRPRTLIRLARATALESTLVNSIATGTNWICGPEKLAQLSALASPRQQIQVATGVRNGAGPSLDPAQLVSRGPLELRVLQYSNLDEHSSGRSCPRCRRDEVVLSDLEAGTDFATVSMKSRKQCSRRCTVMLRNSRWESKRRAILRILRNCR